MLHESVERGLHGRHTRVSLLVDAVPEAHDLALLGECFIEPRHDVLGRADVVEDVQHGLVGATVQRPLERADRADDRRVDVAQGRGDHARGERGGVEGVLGVQDHRAVEGIHHNVVRLFAERHPEEVRGVVEVGACSDDLLAATTTLTVGDDRRKRGEQADAALEVLLGAAARVEHRAAGAGVGGADEADRGTHLVHRVRIQRDQVDRGLDVVGERPVLALLEPEGCELLRSGQLAVPQQVGDGLERLRVRQLLHGVAAVQQAVRLGVDLRDRGRVDDDAREALLDVRLGHGHSFVMVKLKTPESKWLYDS